MTRGSSLVALLMLVACHGSDPAGPDAGSLPPGAIQVDAPAAATTNETGTHVTIALSLTEAPTAPVTIAVSSDDASEGAVSAATVRFATGDVGPHAFDVTGVDDADVDGPQTYHVVFAAATSDDARYAGAVAPAVTLVNTDDDTVVDPGHGVVTVHPQGAGAGTVTSTPAGIACPGTCTATFTAGTTVTLSASAGAGARFGGWDLTTGPSFAATLAIPVVEGKEAPAYPRFVLDQLAWLSAVDGPAGERIRAIAAAGDTVVVAGDVDGPTTIGGAPLGHGGGLDPLIAAYGVDGAARWSQHLGGAGDARVQALAILAGGDVIAGGWFTGELDLGGAVVTAATPRAFVARLAAKDGAIVWAEALASGPSETIAALGATADGGVVACGAGASPLAWLDGAGAVVAEVKSTGLGDCQALDPRVGGWFAGGWGTSSNEAVIASIGDDHEVVFVQPVAQGSAPLLVDDVVTLPGGGAVVAVTAGDAAGSYDSILVRVDAAGAKQDGRLAGIGDYFGRTIAAVRDGAGGLLIVRRDSTLSFVVERWSLAPLARTTSVTIEHNLVLDFDLAAIGGRRFLAGDSFVTTPLPGWPLTLTGDGGFVAELKLP